jgi:scyllo-inositol 2-dehydrogenase (NADP+)
VKTGVGLVGFGLAGRVLHAPLIVASGMEIVGVVTRQAEAVKSSFPAAEVVTDLDELLRMQRVELVVIATPNRLHAPQAIAALRAGRHVVIDKPMALTAADADEIVAAVASSGCHLAVFQNRRWDSDFLTLQRVIAGGALGELSSFEAHWDRFRPAVADRWREHPEEGGGILYDLGPHLVDQALCLFGLPDWLQADVFAQRAGAVVDDTFEIRMGIGRLRITLRSRSLVPDNALRYRLHGTLGSLSKTGMDVQENQLRAGMSPLDPGFGVEPRSQWAQLLTAATGETREVPPERGEWLSFYRSLRASIELGAPLGAVPGGEAGRQVVRVIEAARRSSDAGHRILRTQYA